MKIVLFSSVKLYLAIYIFIFSQLFSVVFVWKSSFLNKERYITFKSVVSVLFIHFSTYFLNS